MIINRRIKENPSVQRFWGQRRWLGTGAKRGLRAGDTDFTRPSRLAGFFNKLTEMEFSATFFFDTLSILYGPTMIGVGPYFIAI